MSKTLIVNYDLNPPANTVIPDAYPSSKAHEIPVNPAAGPQSHSEFYTALREAIAQAKGQIGADLTVWRDAVGALESVKEPKRVQNEEDEEEEESEDEA